MCVLNVSRQPLLIVFTAGYAVEEATWKSEAELQSEGRAVFSVLYDQFKSRAAQEGHLFPSSWISGPNVLLKEAMDAGWT